MRIEMDGEDNHVHLLVEYPPKVAVSSLVNSLKGMSSRLLRKERPTFRSDSGRAFCGRHLTCLILQRSSDFYRATVD